MSRTTTKIVIDRHDSLKLADFGIAASLANTTINFTGDSVLGSGRPHNPSGFIKEESMKSAFIALLAVMCLCFVGCGLTPEEEKIVGTWESFSPVGLPGHPNEKMVFRDDGIVEVYNDGKRRGEFKWKVSVREGAWDRQKSTAETAVHKKVGYISYC